MFEYVGIGRWNFGRSLLDLGKVILIIVSINWYICFSFSVLRNGMWHTIMWKEVKTIFKDIPESIDDL